MSEFKKKDNFEIIVGRQSVKVEYDGISYGIVIHFSFYGNCISSTGYKGYFVNTEEYISTGYTDYKLCAQDIAEFLYKDRQEEMRKNGVIIEQLKFF
jgi:hypothetical protein